MIRTALICGTWEMEFDDHVPATRKGRPAGEVSWLDEIFGGSLAEVSAGTTAGLWLLEDLRPGLSYVEFFGGTGLHSCIIQSKLSPASHTIIEKDPACIRHLERVFAGRPGIRIIGGDSRPFMIEPVAGDPPADVFLIDWSSWTVKHWPEWKTTFQALIDQGPEVVTLFDSAKPYLHFHRAIYGHILDREIFNMSDYTHGLSAFLNRELGWVVSKAAFCPRGTYYRIESALSVRDRPLDTLVVPSKNQGFVWKT